MNAKSIISIVTIAAFLATGTYLYSRAAACDDMQNLAKCPVVIAYSEVSGYDLSMKAYSGASGLRDVLRSNVPTTLLSLLGYDAISDRWMLSATICKAGNCYDEIANISGKKWSDIMLAGLPKDTTLALASYANDSIYVPIVSQGKLVIYCYNLNGKLEFKRELHVPDDSILDQYEPVAVASSGIIAANLKLENSLKDGLYLFDLKGNVIMQLGEGKNLAFSPDGKLIAFSGLSDKSTNDIVIYDIAKKSRRIISVLPPISLRQRVAQLVSEGISIGGLEGLAAYQWSPDGRYLVCSYFRSLAGERAIFAIDISGEQLKWYHLPVYVEDRHWTVLDKMPELLSK